jgi:hypothetical protein
MFNFIKKKINQFKINSAFKNSKKKINKGLIPKNQFPLNGIINFDYNYKPKTSIIINYFTSLKTMMKTIDNLRTLGDEIEIIIHNDKAMDCEKILKKLNRTNDKMIVSKEIGETYGWRTSASLAIGEEYFLFIQDDDLAPDNKGWYEDCLNEFNKDNDLGMIGMIGGGCYPDRINGGIDFSREINFKNNFEKFYCSWLKTGPIMIRKKVYKKINGWIPFADIGEADHYTDQDLTMRTWLSGSKAMLLLNQNIKQWKRRFNRGDGLTKKDLTIKDMEKNMYVINRDATWHQNQKKYFKKNELNFKKIDEVVKKENLKLGITNY